MTSNTTKWCFFVVCFLCIYIFLFVCLFCFFKFHSQLSLLPFWFTESITKALYIGLIFVTDLLWSVFLLRGCQSWYLLSFCFTESITKAFYIVSMFVTGWFWSVVLQRGCQSQYLVLFQDRVLFRTRKKNQIACLHYDAVMNIKVSDHRAVYAFFEVMLRPGRDKLVVIACTLTLFLAFLAKTG